MDRITWMSRIRVVIGKSASLSVSLSVSTASWGQLRPTCSGASFAHGWQSRPTDGERKNIVNNVNTVNVVNTVLNLAETWLGVFLTMKHMKRHETVR